VYFHEKRGIAAYVTLLRCSITCMMHTVYGHKNFSLFSTGHKFTSNTVNK
jgi:hypothetical protein